MDQGMRADAPSRRQALSMLGAGAAAAALPSIAGAQPAFEKGAVIRTLLKDYNPADLAGGATLFHEHMSMRAGFMVDWVRYSAEARAASRVPNAPAPPAPAAQSARAQAAPSGTAPNTDRRRV
jgi:hypothetical protein